MEGPENANNNKTGHELAVLGAWRPKKEIVLFLDKVVRLKGRRENRACDQGFSGF